jgi:sugar (pentulose or hexulose) kinase
MINGCPDAPWKRDMGRIMAGLVVVIDIGKTHSKASLWTRDGQELARTSHSNRQVEANGYPCLDIDGIEAWLRASLSDFARKGTVAAIIPIAHGAACAVVRGRELVAAPMDYEAELPADILEAYRAHRDAFSETGSPAMDHGLNLGAQLHALEARIPDLFTGDAVIVPWPQYWAWRFTGVAVSEVTSLGAHTDLWSPLGKAPSPMAVKRGWAQRLAPLYRAGDVVGTLLPEWSAATGLPAETQVHAGLHDSNAALLAARMHPEIRDRDAAIVSTGTWFVTMRSSKETQPAFETLGPGGVVNVDVNGSPVPTLIFMGGREVEILSGDGIRIDDPQYEGAIMAALRDCVSRGAMILPTFVPGTGPFPKASGEWLNRPRNPVEKAATVALYAALLTDLALTRVGARGTIMIDGRFARSKAFVSVLARLQTGHPLYVANQEADLAIGALSLLSSTLSLQGSLELVDSCTLDLSAYRSRWLEALGVPREGAPICDRTSHGS